MPSAAALAALEKLEKAAIVEEIPEDDMADIIKQATDRVHDMTSRGNIFDEKVENEIVKFDIKELNVGKQLGVGGFCTVKQIDGINISCNIQDPPLHSREYMAMQCIREVGGPRYAIKELSSSSKTDKTLCMKGIADIVVEARLLAVIQHQHIIKIRGFGSCGYFNKDFFILMDRLDQTLDRKINEWRDETRKSSGMLGKFSKKKKEKVDEIKDEKVDACRGVASAIRFLHSKNIIYRDLKPENIGFDIRGSVKLFDFGLSTEVTPSKACDDGTYKLTGNTGSPIYMAPEVGNSQPYNFMADSYSFGLLLWQIIAMKTPFAKITMQVLEEIVYNGNHRPKIEENWSKNLSGLMQACWSRNWSDRPSFDDIVKKINNESMEGMDQNNLDLSRRSYHAMLYKLK